MFYIFEKARFRNDSFLKYQDTEKEHAWVNLHIAQIKTSNVC